MNELKPWVTWCLTSEWMSEWVTVSEWQWVNEWVTVSGWQWVNEWVTVSEWQWVSELVSEWERCCTHCNSHSCAGQCCQSTAAVVEICLLNLLNIAGLDLFHNGKRQRDFRCVCVGIKMSLPASTPVVEEEPAPHPTRSTMLAATLHLSSFIVVQLFRGHELRHCPTGPLVCWSGTVCRPFTDNTDCLWTAHVLTADVLIRAVKQHRSVNHFVCAVEKCYYLLTLLLTLAWPCMWRRVDDMQSSCCRWCDHSWMWLVAY